MASAELLMDVRLDLMSDPPKKWSEFSKSTTIAEYSRSRGLSVRTSNVLIRSGVFDLTVDKLFDEYDQVACHRQFGFGCEYEIFEMFYCCGVI